MGREIYPDKAFRLWQLRTKYMLTNVRSNKSLPWEVRVRQHHTRSSGPISALLEPNVKGGLFLIAQLRWLSEHDCWCKGGKKQGFEMEVHLKTHIGHGKETSLRLQWVLSFSCYHFGHRTLFVAQVNCSKRIFTNQNSLIYQIIHLSISKVPFSPIIQRY